MSNARSAQKTKFYIAGSAGTSYTITGITPGIVTIVTISGHGLANGDTLTIAGVTGADAALLNGITGLGAVVTNHVTGATNDSFVLDVDTSGKTLTATGTVTPATWSLIGELQNIKPSGASATKIDVTTIDSDAKEYRAGLIDHGTLSAEVFYVSTDPGLTAVKAAFRDGTVCTYKEAFTDGSNLTFDAVVLKCPTTPEIAIDAVLKGTAEWQISGDVVES